MNELARVDTTGLWCGEKLILPITQNGQEIVLRHIMGYINTAHRAKLAEEVNAAVDRTRVECHQNFDGVLDVLVEALENIAGDTWKVDTHGNVDWVEKKFLAKKVLEVFRGRA